MPSHQGQTLLDLAVADGFTPNLVLDRADRTGRRDARGGFRRVYTRGEQVMLEAEPVYAAYVFDRWTDARGRDLSPQAREPVLTVSLDQDTAVRAVYRSLPVAGAFRRGDANGDGLLDISDGTSILNFLFLGASTPSCVSSADANDDGGTDISDGLFVLSFLFLGGPAPPAPHGQCGTDPTPDELTCESYHGCE